jgi:acetylornithine/N-succinyldiaminopimelate aminotransferase
MNSADCSTDALMYITDRPSQMFVRGKGAWLWDQQGRRYLDFIQGWAVNALGHSPIEIRNALAEQSSQLINASPAYFNEPSARLARRLTELSVFDRVFFTNSGAEANEGAIKLARRWGNLHKQGAYEIITFNHGFHGRTLATMSASGKAAFCDLFEPKVAGFPKATLNDLDSVARLINPKTVAVMLEPIQGEAGVFSASDRFMRDLRELTAQHHLLLIVDEIQTGVGRTGKLWAYEHSGIEPDIMTLGKGLGGGVPLAALLATEGVSCFRAGDQGGTFNGNPLMTAVGYAVLQAVAEPIFLASVNNRGAQLRAGLELLSSQFGLGEVRGRGLLQALALNRPIGTELVRSALEQGLLINAPRTDCLRLMPALNVSADEISTLLAMLDKVLYAVE